MLMTAYISAERGARSTSRRADSRFSPAVARGKWKPMMIRSAVPVALFLIAMSTPASAQAPGKWPPNSMDRPRPPVVDPGPERAPVPPPADAIVLFDGRSLAEWAGDSAAPARWTVRDGYMEVAPGTGTIRTKRAFGRRATARRVGRRLAGRG